MEKQDIINYVLNTPENTNPVILNGMLSQLEAGGGGASDLEWFEITLNLTPPENVTLAGTALMNASIDYPESFTDGDTSYMCSPKAVNNVVKIIAYEGVAYFLNIEGIDSEYNTYIVKPETLVITGDITEEDGYYKVTGNGTITATLILQGTDD